MKDEWSHHRRPRPSRGGPSSSGSPRRCRPRPWGTPDRTASPPSPRLAPGSRARLRTAAEAAAPDLSCWTLVLRRGFPSQWWWWWQRWCPLTQSGTISLAHSSLLPALYTLDLPGSSVFPKLRPPCPSPIACKDDQHMHSLSSPLLNGNQALLCFRSSPLSPP